MMGVDDPAPAGVGATPCTSDAGVAVAAYPGCARGVPLRGRVWGLRGARRVLSSRLEFVGPPLFATRQLGAWPGWGWWAWPVGPGARVGSARGEIRRGGGGPARRMRAALF